MNIAFDQPALLLLGLLALPMLWLGFRALAADEPARRRVILVARAALIVALAVLLAGARWRREHDHLTVIGLLDISGSVRRFAVLPDWAERDGLTYIQVLRDWFREATGTRAPDDRFGLVVFDGEAVAISAPTTADWSDDGLDLSVVPGTSIEDAIRLGLAMFPADTARRLVLVSDGNETVGSAVEAARLAAAGVGVQTGGVPIDVLPISYSVRRDVQLTRLEVPPRAQPGQTVTARIVVESTHATRARLHLRREGLAIDLAPGSSSTARTVDLPRGQSVHLASVVLGDVPVNRFEAMVETLAGADDALPDNDRAEAFTATPGKGRVLIVHRAAGQRRHPLERLLRGADIPYAVVPPIAVTPELLGLQNEDLIVIDDVPAFEFTPAHHDAIARHVHDLGGGLLMLGGWDALGAGGWNGTTLEEVLPLELDPPRELRLPQAALVLVLDRSGSMERHVGGARATQMQIATESAARAIESLRAESLVGIVTFSSTADELQPIRPNDDPRSSADLVRKIGPGGGTNLHAPLALAGSMLRDIEAERKHIVFLTDGQAENENLEDLVLRMNGDGIRLTTIAIGDDADHELLETLATLGQGEFYPVYDPTVLPRVLVDSVQVVNKPLVKEGAFLPVVQPTGSTITIGMEQAPPLGGLVVTAPRADDAATVAQGAVVEMTHPDGEPLLAHWQAGLGRTAIFASSIDGEWAESWSGWAPADAFWLELVRRIARPSMSHEAELVTTIESGELRLTLDAADETGVLDYLEVTGRVYRPDGAEIPVRLRQTAPGRYEATMPAIQAGNYIVALTPRQGARQLAPIIGGASLATGAEFRRYQSDLALLDQLVELTRGRRLALEDPARDDLFEREGLPRSVSLLPVWHPMLVLVAALLLLDVAARRIAWTPEGVRAAVAQLVSRVTPGHVRGRQAAATLATLRQRSAEVDARLDRKAARGAKREPAQVAERPARVVRRKVEKDKETSRVADAVAAFIGRPRGAKPEGDDDPTKTPSEAPASEKPAAPETPENKGSTETTSSLLEAKRRARKRM